MYLWKCWRDTRWFLVIFLGIAIFPMPFTALVTHGGTAILDAGAIAMQNTFIPVVTAIAYALATICAIQDFTDKTAHFLFTKPRSRTYFVWTSWAIGLAELLLVAGVNFLAGWVVLAHYGVSPFKTALTADVTPQHYEEAVVYACFAYALTFTLAVVFRNGLKGLGASLGLMAGMVGVVEAIHMHWNIWLPVPPQQIGRLPFAWSEAVWLAVALCFVFAAQVVVERAEI